MGLVTGSNSQKGPVMDAMQAILARKSTRSYKEDPIDEETLRAILEAGMAAPVGSGAYDSLHLAVVQDKALFSQINTAVSDMIFKMMGKRMDKSFGAPVMVFVSSKPAMVPGMEYANAACVAENMAIAATGLGIDSIVWAAASAAVAQSEELLEKLAIPEGFTPLLCISLGYGAGNEKPRKHEIAVSFLHGEKDCVIRV